LRKLISAKKADIKLYTEELEKLKEDAKPQFMVNQSLEKVKQAFIT